MNIHKHGYAFLNFIFKQEQLFILCLRLFQSGVGDDHFRKGRGCFSHIHSVGSVQPPHLKHGLLMERVTELMRQRRYIRSASGKRHKIRDSPLSGKLVQKPPTRLPARSSASIHRSRNAFSVNADSFLPNVENWLTIRLAASSYVYSFGASPIGASTSYQFSRSSPKETPFDSGIRQKAFYDR